MTTARTGTGGRAAVPLVALSVVVVAVVAGFAQGIWLANLHNGLLAVAFTSVGAYVLHQQPRNRCGWAFLATGTVEAVMFLGRQIGHDPAPGTSAWWGWLGVWPLVVAIALVTLSVIWFPDGTFPSPAWRWVVRVGAVLTVVLAIIAALWPVGAASAGVDTPHPFTVVGAATMQDVWDAVARPTFVAFQAVWLAAVAARWRSSGRLARRQLLVVGGAVTVSLVTLLVGLALTGAPTAGVLAVCLVPIAAGWLEVLELMAQGRSNAAICEELHLSIKTVEPTISSVFTKLDLPPGRQSNRRVLAVLAYVDHQPTSTLGS